MSESTRAERAKREVQSDDESTAPAQQITDFPSLDVTPVNVNRYVVCNRKNGTVYKVNLNDPSCSCEDYQYNRNKGDSGACKHIKYAVYSAPDTRDMSEEVLRDAAMLFTEARQAVETTDESDSAPNAPSSTDAGTDASQDSEKPPANPDKEMADKAEAAADKLQAAYDDIVDGMEAVPGDGVVWVSNGTKEDGAPDWTFSSWLQEADMVHYDPDGEDADPPEYYLKNFIYPSDVDRYINEVLEG